MKKALVILSIIAAAISLTSCHLDGATVRTEDYTIEPTAWIENAGSLASDTYYYITCEADFISKSACEDGTVNAYLWLPGTKTWTPLPYVTLYMVSQGMGSVPVAENIRFEYAPGEVTFIVQDMNGNLPVLMVDALTFRVAVTR